MNKSKHLFYFVFFFLLMLSFGNSFAQGSSNKGTDFWLGYGTHISTGNMVLYITSDVNTTSTVTIPSLGFTQTVNITANTVQTVNIPTTAHLTVEGKSANGIHVTSLKPVIVYAHIYQTSVSGATLVLPVNTLGKDYYSINYKQISNSPSSASWFFIVAVEDNTQVEITPSQTTQGGWAANSTNVISLNKGEIYNVLGRVTNVGTSASYGVDLTGSRIKSISSNGTCKKIAVFSGSSKIAVNCLAYSLPLTGNPNPGSADNLFQQVYPTATWGKNFITVPQKDRNFVVYRIVKSDPTAVVTLNGTIIPAANFINNFYYEFDSQKTDIISSDKPIQTVQYAVTQNKSITCGNSPSDVGDPEMIFLNPLEQTLTQITMYSTLNFAIQKHFINVVVKNEGVASFKVDGVSVSTSFSSVPNSSTYSYAQLSVALGTHTLICDEGFNAIAYGFGNADSYGYAAGANLTAFGVEPVESNNNSVVQNGCINIPYSFNLKLPYQPIDIYLDKGDSTGLKSIPINFISTSLVNGETSYNYSIAKDIIYITPNTYTFKLKVIKPTLDDCGTGDEFDYDFIINALPVSNFTVVPKECIAKEVSFIYQPDPNEPNIATYLWDFNGEASSSIKDAKHTFNTIGKKKIRFSTKSSTGCWSNVVEKEIEIFPLPVVNFNSTTPNCETKEIQFSDISTAAGQNILGWKWDFGVANSTTDTSILKNPIFNFPIEGNYNVTLRVTSDIGCVTTLIKTITVNPLPIVDFETPDICLDDALASFVNKSTVSGNQTLTYKWDFGDPTAGTSNFSTTVNPSFKYSRADNYLVKLIATSSSGCITELIKTFTVNGSTPKADFEIENQNTLCANKPVVFVDKSLVDFGQITKIEWYFDNSKPSIAIIDNNPALRTDSAKKYNFTYPSFTSPTQKNIKVKMVVYSGLTCLNSIEKDITIFAVPVVVFNNLKSVCEEVAPYQITQAAETGGLIGNGIFVGKGVSASGIFSPAAAGVGTHDITYTFTTLSGCIDFKTQQITVYPTPKADAGNDEVILVGGNIKLNGIVSGNAVTYKWIPSVGLDKDDILTPSASPIIDTKYTLMVTSADNCVIADEVFIKVLQFPIVPTAFTPNDDGINDTWEIKYLDSYPKSSVLVFNRYGKEVYKSDNYSVPWDGKLSGTNLPDGMYYYIITANAGQLKYTGSIMLMR